MPSLLNYTFPAADGNYSAGPPFGDSSTAFINYAGTWGVHSHHGNESSGIINATCVFDTGALSHYVEVTLAAVPSNGGLTLWQSDKDTAAIAVISGSDITVYGGHGLTTSPGYDTLGGSGGIGASIGDTIRIIGDRTAGTIVIKKNGVTIGADPISTTYNNVAGATKCGVWTYGDTSQWISNLSCATRGGSGSTGIKAIASFLDGTAFKFGVSMEGGFR
jgi:hypothetical protein